MNSIVRKLIMTSAVALVVSGMDGSKAAEVDSHAATNTPVTDARRETQILTRFNADAQLRGYDLTVIVDGDQAALGGVVDTDVARQLAGQVATDAAGIKHVDNRIRVDAGAVPPARTRTVRSADTIAGDATISAAVKSRLLWNAHTEGLDIRVDTREGRVTLAGNAISYAERDVAGIVAGNTDGVINVNNELALTDQPRPVVQTGRDSEKSGMSPTDSWITSRVKSSLQLTRGISRSAIAVTTRRGVVSLSGTVASEADRELAMRVAQDTRGVKDVDADGLTAG
jgi:hyperosmotically inducible protein